MRFEHLRALVSASSSESKRRLRRGKRPALRFERHPLLEPLEQRRLLACQTLNATLPCVDMHAYDKTLAEGEIEQFETPILTVAYHAGAGEDVVPEFEVGIAVLPNYPDDAFGLRAEHSVSGEVQYIGDGSRLKLNSTTGSWNIYFEAYKDSVNPEPENDVIVAFEPDGSYDINTGSTSISVVTITDPNQAQSENPKSCSCTCSCADTGNNKSETKTDKNEGAAKPNKSGGGAQKVQYASEANPHPIVTVRALHPQLTGSASRVEATLTLTSPTGANFTKTEHFSVSGLAANDQVSYGVQVDTSTGGTGRYRWTMTFAYFNSQNQPVSVSSGQTSYSGYKHVVDFTDSKFGNRWNHPDVDRLFVQSSAYYTGALLVRGNGETDFFTGSGVGVWPREEGERGFSTLEKLSSGGNFKLTDKYGNISWFTSTGYLDFREDRNGNITNYTYDGQNRLTQITDVNGRNTTFVYDITTGYIDYVDDFTGRRTQYTVQSVNGVYKLTSVTDPDPDGAGGPQTETTTNYSYDSSTHILTQITDGVSGVTTFAYTDRRLTGVTHPDGGEFEMDAFQTRARGSDTSTNPPDSFRGWTRQARERDPSGGETVSVLDRYGYPIRTIDANGKTTNFSRNEEGLVIKEEGPDSDDFGPLGRYTTYYGYDGDGNLLSQTMPGSRKRTWGTYNNFGGPSSYTDELGNTTNYEYDAQGNLLYSQQIVGTEDAGFTYSASTGQVTGDTDDIFHSYLYTTGADNTLLGLVKKAYDPLDRVTEYAYYTAADQATHPNTKGLLKQVTLPAVGGVTATRTFDYDAYGNLDTYTDEENRLTTWQYDALDRLTKETLPDPDTGDAVPAPYREYTYDKLNRRTSERDEEGNVTNYAYQHLSGGGLKVTVTEPARDGASQPTVSEYHFDALGNLSKTIDPLDRETTYAYDLARRLETITYPDPDHIPGGADGPLKSPVTSYNYDAMGRLLGVVESSDGAKLDPELNPGLEPAIESGAVTQWNVTTAIGTSEIDLFTIFQDDHDADTALGYTIVGNTNSAFFDALSVSATSPRKLLLDFKANNTGTSVVTVRATDKSGLWTDHAITVVRTQAQNEIEFRLNSTTTGTQKRPIIEATPDGGFVAVWEDTNTGIIRAQRFQDSGSTTGSEFQVSHTGGGGAPYIAPSVTAAPDGKLLFTYWRNGNGYSKDLYRRWFNSDATPAGSEATITAYSATEGDPTRASVTFLENGQYVIVWRDSVSGDSTVKGARYSSSDVLQGSIFTVNTTTTGIQSYPAVTATRNGGFVVVWSGNGSGDGSGVFSRYFLANGTPVGNEMLVNGTTSGNQVVAAIPDGGFVTAWHGNGTDAQSGATDTIGIFARLRGADGTPASGDILVNQSTTNSQLWPAVAVLPDGGFVVAWQGNPGSTTDLYVRRFAANGVPLENEMVVNTTTVGSQTDATLAVTSRGAVIAAWGGQGNSNLNSPGDTEGIFARLLPAHEPGNALSGPFRALSVVPGETVIGPVTHLLATFSQPLSTSGWGVNDFLVSGPTPSITVTSATIVSATQALLVLNKDIYAGGTYNVQVKANVRKGAGGTNDQLDQDGDGTPGETSDDVYLPSFHLLGGHLMPAAEEAPYPIPTGMQIDLVEPGYDAEIPVSVVDLRYEFADANEPSSELTYSVDDISATGLLDSVQLDGWKLRLYYARGYYSETPTIVTVRATDKTGRSATKTIDVTKSYPLLWGDDYDAGANRLRVQHLSAVGLNLGWFDRFVITFSGPVDSIGNVTVQGPDGPFTMSTKQISSRQYLALTPVDQGQHIKYTTPGSYSVTIPTASHTSGTTLNQDDDGQWEFNEDEFRYTFRLQSGAKPKGQFDQTGFLTRQVDVFGNATTYTFDKAGNVTSVTDPLGATSRYEYDTLGRLVRAYQSEGYAEIDDDEDPGTTAFQTTLGTWSSDTTQGLNGDNLFVAGAGTITAKAEWTFTVEPGKQYEVVATWPKDPDQATNAPYRMYDGASSGPLLSTVRVDQEYAPLGHLAFGKKWQSLDFVQVTGTTLTVQLANDANNFVTADAVRIIESTATEYEYDKVGNVTSVTDAQGQTKYVYDARDRLTEVWLPDPTSGVPSATYKTSYEYDKVSQLTKVIDALGAQTKYEYDRLGRVNKVIQPDPVTGALSSTLFTTYKYDQIGNLTEITEPSLGAPWGSPVTTYAYDKHYNLTSVTDADPDGNGVGVPRPITTFTYDDADRLTRMTDPLTRQTDYKYDELDQLTEVKGADPDTLGGTNRPVTKFAYDQRGNRTLVTDPLGRTTQYGYDPLDRLVTVTNPIGGIAATLYDESGQVAGQVDELGRLTEYAYDLRDNLIEVTLPSPRTASAPSESPVIAYEYDSVGNRTKMTDALANVTKYLYDRQNRLTSVTEPDPDAIGSGDPSPVTTYTYDAVGRMLTLQESLTSGTTRKWKRDYDKLGRLTKLTEPNAVTGLDTGAFTTYVYDSLSRLTQVTQPDPDAGLAEYVSPVTNYAYDALSRHTSTTLPDPDGAGGLNRPVWSYEYDAASQRTKATSPDPNDNPSTGNPAIDTTYAYDYLGRLKSETSELGYVTAYAYDLTGNLTRITEPDPDGSTSTLTTPLSFRQYDALDRLVTAIDEREGITRYAYDGAGNVTSLTDPVLNKTTYAFDRLDRVTSETNQRGDARKYEYDRNSNVTKQIDREGRVRKFTYDNLARAKTEEWFANVTDVTADRTITWAYNLADELTSASDPAATYSYANDKLGRVELVTSEIAGLGATKKVFLRQTYDALGRRKDSLATIGSTEAGGTKDYSNVYKYDGLSRLKRLDQDKRGTGAGYNEVAEKRVDFVYDQLGRFTSIARSKDLDGGATNEVATATYTYDNGGRLTDLDYKKGATDLTGYNLFYDQLDRLTRMEFTNASYASETADYKYDATDQLIVADRSSTANDESYVHDLNGNRRTTGTLNSVIDTNNRLANDGTYTYLYDKEGNRTKRTKTSDSSYTDYVYDHRQRLTSAVTKSVGGTVTRQVDYTYDAFDRLVKRVTDLDGAGVGPATTEYFAYDGHDVALRFDSAGNLTKRYLNGPAADQVLAEEQIATAIGSNDRTFWAISDYAGTVRDVYNSAGTLKNHLTIDAFGNIKTETATSVDFLYAFQGLLRDEATGLYLTQTRWLDPLTGKWLQEDWISFTGGDANLARFVGNSPTNYVDPTGKSWWNPYDWLEAGCNYVCGNDTPTPPVYTPPVGLPPVATDQAPPEEDNSAPNHNANGRRKVTDVDLSLSDVWDVFNPVNWYWGAADQLGDALIVVSGTLYQGLGLDQAVREVQVNLAMRHLDSQLGIDMFNASRRLGSSELWAAQELSWFAVGWNLARFCELAGQAASTGWCRCDNGLAGPFGPQGRRGPFLPPPDFGGGGPLPPLRPPVKVPPGPPPAPPKPPAKPPKPTRQRRPPRPKPQPVQVPAPPQPQPQVVKPPVGGGGGGNKGGVLVKQGGNNPPSTPPAPTPPKKGNGPAGFSTTKLGNEVHGRFEKVLTEQTGTRREDWLMRTKPGETGIDATYIGPKNRYPGFKYAELKPYTQNGYDTFQRQMDRWQLPGGQTQLYFYNGGGIIGSSGINY